MLGLSALRHAGRGKMKNWSDLTPMGRHFHGPNQAMVHFWGTLKPSLWHFYQTEGYWADRRGTRDFSRPNR